MTVADRIVMRATDENAKKAIARLYLNGTVAADTWEADLGDLISAIAGVSGAVMAPGVTLHGSETSAASNSGPYSDIEDKIQWIWDCAEGQSFVMETSAPVVNTGSGLLFLEDDITVDQTNAEVLNFVAAVIAYGCDIAGRAITGLNSAERIRRKLQR